MPNQPKTPPRSVRVPGDLWQAAKARAKEKGETVSDVIVRALKHYRSYPASAMKPALWDAICRRDDDDFESAFGWEEAEWAVDDRHALLAEVERLRAELEPLRTLRHELMTVLPYADEDVETSLVVAAERYSRADLPQHRRAASGPSGTVTTQPEADS